MGLSALALLGAASPARLEVGVQGLRSAKGLIRLCLTTDPARYPDCTGDPAARTLTVPARRAALIGFANLPSGDYAIALIHDENGNGRLDTLAGIPREGVGFSRNPPLMFGAPRFAAAKFALATGDSVQQVRVKYIL